jgi:hypothetical protein
MSLPDYMITDRERRPVGISILSILHILGGVLLAGLMVASPFIFSREPEIAARLSDMGIPLVLLYVGILFLTVLTLGSGIGMWIGAKWGWYLGLLYNMYSTIRNLFALLHVYLLVDPTAAEEMGASSRGPEYYYFKFAVRAVIHSLILLYFFKGNVVNYFGIKDRNNWKILLVEFAVCIGIAYTVAFWSAMIS